MTRRQLLSFAALGPVGREPAVMVPVRRVIDASGKLGADSLRKFDETVWRQAVDDFAGCGVFLHATDKVGDVSRPSQREPVLAGLERGAVNVVLTDRIPMYWDVGRGLGGVTLLYRGFHLSMVSVVHAHRHLVPMVSLNTCVHELLHLLLHDVFEQRPAGAAGHAREARVDAYATRMWLLGDGAAVKSSARRYLDRLRA